MICLPQKKHPSDPEGRELIASLEIDLDAIEQRARAATQERWHYCGYEPGTLRPSGEERLGCDCMTIMAPDHPIAVTTSGDWGDEYPTLKIEGSSFDRTVSAVMEMSAYGHVEKATARANAAHIAGMDPTTVLALVALIRGLQKDIAQSQTE